jgi:hypothetical protein
MKALIWGVCGQVFLGLTDLTIVQNPHVNRVNPHSQTSPRALNFQKLVVNFFPMTLAKYHREKTATSFMLC